MRRRGRGAGFSGRACEIVAVTALLAASLAGCGGGSSSSTTPGLVLSPCSRDGISARCGTLLVREQRLADTGRRIPLRVVVFPAAAPRRHPDPIVWFAGGPGDSAVDMINRVRPLFGAVTDRDVVFIDQRGTGASKLTCPAFPGLADKAALRTSVESCLQHLQADLGSYTTAMSVDDVDEVLTDLQYAKVNVVGISYGATAEQVFLERHADRVRTMTLLSGTLLDVPVFERFPQNAQRALDEVFDECAGDPGCHRAFPELRADWSAAWNSINQHPWVVPADRSPTGRRVVFDADWLATGLHQQLTVATTQAGVPLLIHILGSATDRVAALLAIAKAMPEDQNTTASGNQMLAYATRCNEAWARFDPDRLGGSNGYEYQSDLANARWWQYVCRLISPAHALATSGQQPSANVPVLALNGEADPQDPPANMTGAAALWPNSLELAVPGQAHDLDPNSAACVTSIMTSFIDRGAPDDLDTTCLSTLGPPQFPLTLQALARG
ncbi:MAG TPA: alpha/beta hydrolase [Jatrophihabitans sp.]|jgi:pimeloyl-ACP methyl ester carboxylesterase|nr:alpha/beta hydrolase [Jatrophihabitans sp.]